jgi:hypothetical protein
MNWLRLLQPFHDHGPRCDWPGCLHRARGVYGQPDNSALALCERHIRELAEGGQLDLDQGAHHPPHVADIPGGH